MEDARHLLGIHPVSVVGAENHDVVRILVVAVQVEQACVAPREAAPARAQPLLGGNRVMYSPGQDRTYRASYEDAQRSSDPDLY